MNDSFNDTIAAISTAVGQSGISVIRVSGRNSVDVVSKIFRPKSKKPFSLIQSHLATYGHIYADEVIVDEVLVTKFLAPRSYTKEDVIEISCHGGQFVTQKIFQLILDNGSRISEPGEFTKRAFMNGRIDLTKAEAVMDIISANSESALKLAQKGLRGDIFEKIRDLRENLVNCLAQIAVNIDYPEYDDVEELTSRTILPSLNKLKDELQELISRSQDAQILKLGINTVIVGRPNVGKSSLLNALLRENKAIVTNIPGTTRDVIEGQIYLETIALNLIDTAGIRDTSDFVEQLGVIKTKECIEKADLILLLLDGSAVMTEEDKVLLAEVTDKKHLVIVNKCDLPQKLDQSLLNSHSSMTLSTYNPDDILKLEKVIVEYLKINLIQMEDQTYLSNTRQIQLSKRSLELLGQAIYEAERGTSIDILDLLIRSVWTTLGEIIGDASPDELINEMFSRFCLGK